MSNMLASACTGAARSVGMSASRRIVRRCICGPAGPWHVGTCVLRAPARSGGGGGGVDNAFERMAELLETEEMKTGRGKHMRGMFLDQMVGQGGGGCVWGGAEEGEGETRP